MDSSIKVVIKSQITDNNSNNQIKTIGYKKDFYDYFKLEYLETKTFVTIDIYNDLVILKRKNQEDLNEISMSFKNGKWTEGVIITNKINYINFKCFTKSLKMEDNKIEISYILDYDEDNEHNFKLEYIMKKTKI